MIQFTSYLGFLSLFTKKSQIRTPNHTFPKNFQRIPKEISKEFPKNSQRIPKEFPKNSQRIPKEFSKNSHRIPKEFPKNSQRSHELFKSLYRTWRTKSLSCLLINYLKKSREITLGVRMSESNSTRSCCISSSSSWPTPDSSESSWWLRGVLTRFPDPAIPVKIVKTYYYVLKSVLT